MPEILYVCYEFPRLSETFVYNEYLGLRQLGADVGALAMDKPPLETLSPEARPLVAQTMYVARPGLMAGLAALGLSLVQRPLRTVRALGLLLRGEAPPRRWVAYASHLLYACHVTSRVDLEGVAIFHAHFATGPASVAMFLSVLTGRRFSVVAHAYDIYMDRMALGAKVELARPFLTISRRNRDWLLSRYGESAARTQVVHCGVDTQTLSRRGRDVVKDAPPLVVAVGRLAPKKGHEVLLRACALVRDQGVPFRCAIAGDGEDREPLERLLRDLHLADIVELSGALSHEEALELTARASIAALACRTLPNGDRDGIPVSLMEAMAMGVPVVSTTVSGIPELVDDGSSGRLVEPDDPEVFAQALAQLLRDPEMRRVMGAAAKEKAASEFDLSQTCRRVLTLLRDPAG